MIDDSFGGDAAVVEYDVLIDFHTFLVGFVEAGMTLECAVAQDTYEETDVTSDDGPLLPWRWRLYLGEKLIVFRIFP